MKSSNLKFQIATFVLSVLFAPFLASSQVPTNQITPAASAVMTNGSGQITSGSAFFAANSNSLNSSIGPVPAASITGIVPVASGGTANSNGRNAGTNVSGIVEMSPTTSANGIIDFWNGYSPWPGSLGVAYSSGEAILGASTQTASTNKAFNMPFGFPGGIRDIGWGGNWGQGMFITGYPQHSAIWAFNNTTNGASRTNVISGLSTNSGVVYTNGVDQILNIVGVNPFIDMSICFPALSGNAVNAYTGSANSPVLTNADGTIVYMVDQFGPQYTWTPDTDLRGENNLAGSFGPLGNAGIPYCFSANTTYGGIPGQYPYFVIDWGRVGHDAVVSVPALTVGHFGPVWVTNSAYATVWSADCTTGAVAMTNGVTTISNLFSTATNNGAVTLGSGPGLQDEFTPARAWATLVVNGGGLFNDATGAGNLVGLDFENGNRLFAMGQKNGLGQGIVVASGSPARFWMSGSSDLFSGSTASQTWTEMGGFDGSENLYSLFNININTAGKTLVVRSGTNAKIGTATANGTSAVAVSTTAVTANSLIFLTIQAPSGTPGAPYVSSVTAGTGFSFKSVSGDASTVGWFIVEKQ